MDYQEVRKIWLIFIFSFIVKSNEVPPVHFSGNNPMNQNISLDFPTISQDQNNTHLNFPTIPSNGGNNNNGIDSSVLEFPSPPSSSEVKDSSVPDFDELTAR